MRTVGFIIASLAVFCLMTLIGDATGRAHATGSGTVGFVDAGSLPISTLQVEATPRNFTVKLGAQSIQTTSNCYADPSIIASGSGASVTFGGSTLTHSGFTTNALAGKPVAVSGQLTQSGFAPTYTLTTVTDPAGYADNSLAGLTIVAEDVRGSGATVTYTGTGGTIITDTSKTLVASSLNGLGVLAQWGGFSTSVGTVLSNTANTITLTAAGWVGNGIPTAGATYTVATAAQSTGIIVSNTASVITIAGVWSPSTPKNNVSYSINVPAAKITNSGGSVTYTRRDTGATGTIYTGTTLTDGLKQWTSNEFVGAIVTSGANSATVASNTATVLTLSAWSPATPSANAAYVIAGSMNDSSKSFGANGFTGLSIVGVRPGSSGTGTSYGSFANSGASVSYGASTLTDTLASFPINGLATKTVIVGGVSGVVASNTATVITLTAPWSSLPFGGFPYVVAWLADSTNPFAANTLVGRTVISGSSKATVFANSINNLTLQTVWSPSTPAAAAAYTVTPQAEEAVVSTNSPTRLSLSSGWSPFAPTAGAPYYLLVSTINASIASNTATVITTTAPWSPATPLNGSSYSVANSQPISACGVGSFTTTVSFDAAKLQYVSATSGAFLTSTGRPLYGTCTPTTSSGTVTFSCTTTGQTPLGPAGSGQLASITFSPLTVLAGTSVLTQTTALTDIQGTPVDHTNVGLSIQFTPRCADVSGNGSVAIQDVIQILAQVGKTTASPGWDPKYDMTGPIGAITINDVIYAVAQVGRLCTFVL
jgi:hypothetical protein